MNFTGTITEISTVKTGKTKKGEDWASLDFEVTELNPRNADYPQIALFSYFKSGEYFKYANEFSCKVGDIVDVDFSMKCQVYQKKDGSGQGKFYKNDCFTVKKAEATETPQPLSTTTNVVEEDDDYPF